MGFKRNFFNNPHIVFVFLKKSILFFKMPYINQSGQVEQNRSIFRLSIIQDTFWGVLNLATIFFQTLFSEEASNAYTGGRSTISGSGGNKRPPRSGNRDSIQTYLWLADEAGRVSKKFDFILNILYMYTFF